MVALIVAHVEVVLEYSEKVDCAHLFLELRAVEENDVFAVFSQSGEGAPYASAAEVGDHG